MSNEEEYEICEKFHKRCYSAREADIVIKNAHSAHHPKTSTGKVPRRKYMCQFCNKYHLTSQIAKKQRKNARVGDRSYKRHSKHKGRFFYG